ncbi:hypothetical protein BW13_04195 [Bifidobacterium sp. UTCIF-37]|uniref:Uncharacterized protein n=1 Tax=Bifidobacterium callitrichos DSM 23973 TaxID=1437609 RepID=A0A087A258_9BIFI|nr:MULTISPECIES: hypothetical protein [unclassified Bifidobacterium]KFI52858.1 hypothetical protein BCAL_1537 [Bifidobacterium callitrichos DSM 23973]TPF86710.1 hypothetical protein BW13_04195 [Bifidobacterium sp. UTCIF-37]TPF89853.1 hypothetical protein BW11_04195 [Bifidobacterium sp. UTCIF-38]
MKPTKTEKTDTSYPNDEYPNDEHRWPKPKRLESTGSAANTKVFARNSRRAMPFKATGHKGGISFR